MFRKRPKPVVRTPDSDPVVEARLSHIDAQRQLVELKQAQAEDYRQEILTLNNEARRFGRQLGNEKKQAVALNRADTLQKLISGLSAEIDDHYARITEIYEEIEQYRRRMINPF